MIKTPREARNAIGLLPETICKLTRRQWKTIQGYERNGKTPFGLAQRLAKIYQCSIKLWLQGERGAKR